MAEMGSGTDWWLLVFQASLALALGLSVIVQQNSGVIWLNAIFIDDGFGTLDDETLNTALERSIPLPTRCGRWV
jgi:exonuclease SbcC